MIYLLAILGGILYRIGGMSKQEGKYKLPFLPAFIFNTKTRDLGVPLVAMLCLEPTVWWVQALTFLLMFGAMTTYFSELIRPADDVCIWEWGVTGIAYGLSLLPYAIAKDVLGVMLLRTIILGVTIALWSYWIDDVDLEETGRGFLFIITLIGGGI